VGRTGALNIAGWRGVREFEIPPLAMDVGWVVVPPIVDHRPQSDGMGLDVVDGFQVGSYLIPVLVELDRF
jgi:hypothetical protein